jgi:hypothetical protein
MSLWISRYQKRNKSFYFFSMSFGIFVSYKKKLDLCVFPISYTCKHVISYKCKYVWFHLNMLLCHLKRLTKEQTCQCKRWDYFKKLIKEQMSHGFEVFTINRSGCLIRCRDIFERFWNSWSSVCIWCRY